ncbi:transglycosylase SLT domain-containing protein [bacterium]|nr:transglycosylase SLT domain-containing protein [bacterium]
MIIYFIYIRVQKGKSLSMGNLPIQGDMTMGNYSSYITRPVFNSGTATFSTLSDLPLDYNLEIFEISPEKLLAGVFDFNYSAGGTHSHGRSTYSSSRSVSEKGKELLKNKEFMDKVVAISKRIGCDFKDLLGVMRAESGLNPAAVNKNGGASGLIQFMPKTARGLGTSVEAIRNMSAIQQLDYVEKFLINAKRSAGFSDGEKLSAGQLYALVFLPARAKQEVLTTSNEAYYRCNSATDTNGDGKITRSEMDARAKRFNVDQYIPMEYLA